MMRNKLLIISLIVVILAVFVFYFLKPQVPSQQPPEQLETKEETKPTYKYVTEKPTGWFKTGQEADIVLYATGFNESGGPLVLNHPGKVATDGKRLIISDTWNNRVLIWDEIPTRNNEPPDLVLGQPDFDSNVARLGADGMNWPMGVATDGEKLLVADANNNRVLVWNSFPTINGQPADLVLGAPDFKTRISSFAERDERTHIDWPWDVWTDGERVVVGSTGDGVALIWNTFPTKNNQPPDLILGVEDFSMRFGDTSGISNYEPDPMVAIGGPRSIASDGKSLVIGTYQPPQAFVWNEFPTESGQAADFILQPRRQEHEPPDGVMGAVLMDGKLFLASSHHVFVWNTFPTANQEHDMRLGAERVAEEMLLAPDKMSLFADTFAGPFGVATEGERLFVADTNNNRVLIFNKLPTEPAAKPDVVLGAADFKTNNFVSKKSFTNPTPFSSGEKLFVGSDGFGVFIYDKIPDESKAEADIVLGLNAVPDHLLPAGGRVTSDGKRLIMVHRDDKARILIWNEVPEHDNQPPDILIGGEKRIGGDGMHEAIDVETDGKHLFVSDTGNNRVLVWEEIPTENQAPADFVLGQDDFESVASGSDPNRFSYPVGLGSDGKHLAVADMGNQRILIWKLPITRNGQNPDLVMREMKPAGGAEPTRFNLPQDVEIYDGKLFVADGGFHRVLIWSKFPETSDTPPDIVLGQKDFYSGSPSNARDRLFVPVSISFDGSFLWVGEMKWSNRLLRFSVQPSE